MIIPFLIYVYYVLRMTLVGRLRVIGDIESLSTFQSSSVDFFALIKTMSRVRPSVLAFHQRASFLNWGLDSIDTADAAKDHALIEI